MHVTCTRSFLHIFSLDAGKHVYQLDFKTKHKFILLPVTALEPT